MRLLKHFVAMFVLHPHLLATFPHKRLHRHHHLLSLPQITDQICHHQKTKHECGQLTHKNQREGVAQGHQGAVRVPTRWGRPAANQRNRYSLKGCGVVRRWFASLAASAKHVRSFLFLMRFSSALFHKGAKAVMI